MSDDKTYKAGMELRRAMWGPAGAEEKVAAATDFTRPFEDVVTTYCFGDVWNREGLDKKTRSMITLACLTALSKPNQIKPHVVGAIKNGVSKDEIREIILHSAIYGGIPAGVEALTAAQDVLKQMGLEE